MILTWITDHPAALGLIPEFIRADDPRSASEQINERYQYGGWKTTPGFTRASDTVLVYPGDPPFPAIGRCRLRDELIVVYRSAWVAIIQPDDSFEVARID